MADEPTNAGTPSPEPEAQPQAGTPSQPDEVTTLRSRNAGLDAKVSTLLSQLEAANKARDEAADRLSAYEADKLGAEDAYRAQVERLSAELAKRDTALKAATLAAKYPESHALFGEAIAGMSEDVLAAGETRLRGVPAEPVPPTPVPNNPPRATAPASKTIEEMSLDELRAYGKEAFSTLTWEGITQVENG